MTKKESDGNRGVKPSDLPSPPKPIESDRKSVVTNGVDRGSKKK